MRDNSYDRTIERNYLQKWRFLIPEYEAVKAGKSAAFKSVGDFYRHHGTCSQTFRKYYNRYLQSGDEADLLPRRRGPKWRERREPGGIEVEIIAQRRRGMNRYEIYAALRERRDTVPSPSTIYRVLRRHQLNRRTPAMREEKRRIIKDKLGELGHVDLHQLPRDMFLAPPPAEAMLLELGIKHRYTRPYRPQTNGKVERFWRTLDEDVIEGATFDNLDRFAKELFDYLIYYNNHRPHQALAGQTPKAFAETKTTAIQSAN